MSAARYIQYKGIMYRLAADAPATDPGAILETGPNPTSPAPAKPESENPPTLAPAPGDDDLKTLELLVGNVSSKATALATSLAPLMEKVRAKSRAEADGILSAAKGSIDSLVEDFKLLTSKYAGVARRSMGENKNETKE
jgi:hypothetical protein